MDLEGVEVIIVASAAETILTGTRGAQMTVLSGGYATRTTTSPMVTTTQTATCRSMELPRTTSGSTITIATTHPTPIFASQYYAEGSAGLSSGTHRTTSSTWPCMASDTLAVHEVVATW